MATKPTPIQMAWRQCMPAMGLSCVADQISIMPIRQMAETMASRIQSKS